MFYNPMEYAAPVHENIFATHQHGTMAKFVEGPLLMDLPDYPKDVLQGALNLVAREAAKRGR